MRKSKIKRQKKLVEETLRKKWCKGSTAEVFERCAFCDDARPPVGSHTEAAVLCKKCLCPPEACNNKATGGFIAYLWYRYGEEVQVKDLDDIELWYMRRLLKGEKD